MTSKESVPDSVSLFVSGIFQLTLPKRFDWDTEISHSEWQGRSSHNAGTACDPLTIFNGPLLQKGPVGMHPDIPGKREK